MTQRPLRTLIFSVVAMAVLGGVGAMLLLERRCSAAGGQFVWTEVACAATSRPVILQGDIHRV